MKFPLGVISECKGFKYQQHRYYHLYQQQYSMGDQIADCPFVTNCPSLLNAETRCASPSVTRMLPLLLVVTPCGLFRPVITFDMDWLRHFTAGSTLTVNGLPFLISFLLIDKCNLGFPSGWIYTKHCTELEIADQ